VIPTRAERKSDVSGPCDETRAVQHARTSWSARAVGGGHFIAVSRPTSRGGSHLEAFSATMPKGGLSPLFGQTRLQTSALMKMFLSY